MNKWLKCFARDIKQQVKALYLADLIPYFTPLRQFTAGQLTYLFLR